MASPHERLGALGRTTPASELLAADATLPLSATGLQASLSAIYRAAVQGSPRAELLRMLCIELGKRAGASLVMLARKAGNGTIAIEAASADNALAMAFHRVPECWDGGVAGEGPASAALRSNRAVRVGFSSDSVALWRAAADQEHITDVTAVPFAFQDQVFVLELFAVPAPRTPGAITLDAMTVALQRLLEDVDVIERWREAGE